MTKLKKCPVCRVYVLREYCDCGSTTEDAHYKFIKIRDAPKTDDGFWGKRRGKEKSA